MGGDYNGERNDVHFPVFSSGTDSQFKKVSRRLS